jgi:cell division protein FtsB
METQPSPSRATTYARPPRRGSGVSSLQLIFAVIIAVGLILTINFSTRIAAGRPLLDAYEEVQREILALEQEQARLTAERDYALKDFYVEEWARGRGKMVRAGEKLIIPVPSQTTAAAALPVYDVGPFNPGYRQPENWELWWSLFFDSPPPNFGR